jgi:amidase
MPRADITALDAVAQLAALETRRLTAVDLLRVAVARRGATKEINASAADNLDYAMERARAIDDHREQGDALGPLAGLPITITEALDAEHLASGRTPRRRVRDAAAVARLRRAGAVIWARSGDEARNPWLPDFPASGPQASVAVGLSALDLGVDRAGGLIRESSHAGVFAHRPSRGLVRQRGADPPGFDRMAEMDLVGIGPIARSARDLRLALSVLAEATIAHQAPPLNLNGLKLGLWTKEPAYPLDDAVAAQVESLAAELVAAGAVVTPVRCPVDPARLQAVFTRLDRGARGWPMTHRAWMAADEERAALAAVTARVFEGVEAIIAPAVSAPLNGGGAKRRKPADPWPILAVTLGLPVSVIPAGLTAAGAPVGVQIIGRVNADSRVLSLAEAIDKLLGGYRPPPLED